MFFNDLEQFVKLIVKKHLVRIIKFLVLYALIYTSISNAIKLTKTLYTGNIEETYIKPLYLYMKAPENLKHDASGKFGADNLCLYSAADNYLNTGVMYNLDADPWHRPAMTFPPNLIYLTSLFVNKLNFPRYLLLSNYLQILLICLVSFYYMRSESVSGQNRLFGIVSILFLLSSTTVGMAWFERGQTDLYTASAILFFVKGIKDERWYDFLLAGLLLSFKWSAVPIFAFFSLLYLAIRPSLKSFFNVFLAALPALVVLVPFGANSIEYLKLIADAESGGAAPVGISLGQFYSHWGAKILPLIQVILFFIFLKNKKIPNEERSLVEFLFVMMFSYVCCAFGTYAFEYRTVSVLFLIPLFLGKELAFSKEKLKLSDKKYWILFGIFLLYAFKFETQIVFINKMLGARRGYIIFSSIIPILLYFNLKYSKKANHFFDSYFSAKLEKLKTRLLI